MKRLFVCVLFLASSAATAATALPSAPAPAQDKKYCVPVRDSANRPTGRFTCRTEAQWAQVLRDHGFERPALDTLPNTRSYYRPSFTAAR